MKNIILSIFALIFVSPGTFAFTLGSSTNSSLEGWSGGEVSFDVNLTNCPSNVSIEGAVDTAIKVWNNIASSNLKLTRGNSSSSTTFSSPPVIWCSTNFASDSGQDANFVNGAANWQSSGNVINRGFIVLNAQSSTGGYIGNLSATSLAVIVAHEIGHVLGLGHSEYPAALMYYSQGRSTLNLHQDDIDGITYLYPRNELGKDRLMGCATIQNKDQFRNHLDQGLPQLVDSDRSKKDQNFFKLLSILALCLPVFLWGWLRFSGPKTALIRKSNLPQ